MGSYTMKICLWLFVLLATCNSLELYPCSPSPGCIHSTGSQPTDQTTSQSSISTGYQPTDQTTSQSSISTGSQPTDQTTSQSSISTGSQHTDSILLNTLRPQLCSCDVSNKINLALYKAEERFLNVSNISSNNVKRFQNMSHYDNLPFERNAGRSPRNTIKDLYALKQTLDRIFPGSETDLSSALKDLMCSIKRRAGVPVPITVGCPVVISDDFSTRNEFVKRIRNYFVVKDVISYMQSLRETCIDSRCSS